MRSGPRPSVFIATLLIALLVQNKSAIAAGVAPGNATAVQREQAQVRFLRGKNLYAHKKFVPALVEFRASIDLVASPNARLFVARTLRELGRDVEAYVEFGRTAVEAGELSSQDARYAKAGESASDERKALEPKLAFVTIVVENSGENTVLKVQGEEVRRGGWSEPAPVKPGSAEISVETPPKPPIVKTLELTAGQRETLTIDAGVGRNEPVTPNEALRPIVHQGDAHQTANLRPYALVAGGVGVAGIVTFTLFGVMANAKYNDLKSQCGQGPCTTDQGATIDAGKRDQRIANVGLVVGILGLGAGVALFVVSGSHHENKPMAAVAIGPSSIGLRGVF
ncbi:MAG: hypothetical protein NVS3B20_11270 [Polyangiales bacterium]